MSETAKRLSPDFSVADAEYPSFSLRDGVLLLEFTDWQEREVQVRFANASGVKWQELDSAGPEDRNDSVFELQGSTWLAQYLAADAAKSSDERTPKPGLATRAFNGGEVTSLGEDRRRDA